MPDINDAIYELTATELFLACRSGITERRYTAMRRLCDELKNGGYRDWSLDFSDDKDRQWATGHIVGMAAENSGWQYQLGEAMRVIDPVEEPIPASVEELRESLKFRYPSRQYEFWCGYEHANIGRAMQWVAILSEGELECCFRCLARGPGALCCEAVDHFGGPEKVFEAAIKKLVREAVAA